ncbi:MAG TPA: NAD(P)/FAD-dependent oxidoreductase [Actinocrinis sp.]|nr:NAD(P)/FAD-dependent oxidoreductase [Actinocrinis sp.]
MIDLLVVGGGPAGLATAILGAQAGMEVVVAEPRSAPVDKACGEGLMPAAVGRLRTLGVEPSGHVIRGIRYQDAKHSVDALFRGGATGLGVRRTVLHEAMAARAAELGVRTVPTRVTGFDQSPDCVEAEGIRARYLVGADGLHSSIRRACGLVPDPTRRPRFGLRRHYRMAPWTDLVEVHWAAGSEAYVTPVSDDVIGVAILGRADAEAHEHFDERLSAFPLLYKRLTDAEPATAVRGAGPLRQDVRRRGRSNVLLVGDASGYIDALTGEGISVALAQAAVLIECLRTDRAGDYDHEWRRVSRKSSLLTNGLLRARHTSLVGPLIVPAAARLPRVFTAIVNQVAHA